MGTQLLPPKGTTPNFRSMSVVHGQTAKWIKMPLGKKVGLDPGDIVLDGDPALPPKKGAQPPTVSPNFRMLWPNGWIKIPVGTEVGLDPGHIVLDGPR